MPEELALDQLAWDRGHVDGDEGTVPALAVVVQRTGHQFFAGARLAGDHDLQVGTHEAGEDTVDVLHRRRAADERQGLFRIRLIGRAGAVRGRA